MDSEIYNIAILAYIDSNLDEIKEDIGDLPEVVDGFKRKADEMLAMVDETTAILENVKKFTANSKITLVELKDKEEKLSKQQFLVRNNKEFDAITKEIETIRTEHSKLIDELRTVGMKEENLLNMLEQQRSQAELATKKFEEKKAELASLSSDHNKEIGIFKEKRDEIAGKINKDFLNEYERVRAQHKDAGVIISRNSCTGCYYQVPPQKIVEIRNNLNTLYFCENCGRVLFPDEFVIDDSSIF